MGRLGKGLMRTCFLMAAAVESPEAVQVTLLSHFVASFQSHGEVVGSESCCQAAYKWNQRVKRIRLAHILSFLQWQSRNLGDGMPLVQAGFPTTLDQQ